MHRSSGEAPPNSSRRRFLATTGAIVGALPVVAGCTGRSSDERSTPAETASPTAEDPTMTTGTTSEGTASPSPNGARAFAGHPAGQRLDVQPRLGPAPSEATAVVVAFEDPSCPRCAAFERETVPKIRSELVDEGVGAFVSRSYPIVYPWGKPATQALESTYARDAAAFWALADHYFSNQGDFDADTVLPKTREFLRAETSLDAAAVVDDAANRRHDAAVQTDVAAGEDAGANATPTVFLFRDGEYRTRAAGSVSYTLVKNALDL